MLERTWSSTRLAVVCHTKGAVASGGLLFYCPQNTVLWKNGFFYILFFFLNMLTCFFMRFKSICDLTVLQCYVRYESCPLETNATEVVSGCSPE